MEIIYFNHIDSTQTYLVKKVKKNLDKDIAIVAKNQLKGIGSRGNSWIAKEGDLIFSFTIKKSDLPQDLPISSASIYFGYLLKEVLSEFEKDIYLKWPNDIYLKEKKCGGVITNIIKNRYIVGIGLNLAKRDDGFGYIILTNPKKILDLYFKLLKMAPRWKQILTKFRLEFKSSLGFKTHINGKEVALKDAILCEDGAILINNERVYSLR